MWYDPGFGFDRIRATRIMAQVWLHNNRRVMRIAMLPCVVGLAVSLGLVARADAATAWSAVLWSLAGLFGILLVGLLWAAARPRLGYASQYLLVYLRFGRPYRVPIELVEMFFIGQSDASLPSALLGASKVTSIVVRLAESATDWKCCPVDSRRGRWEDGYITLRGTWCEPITKELAIALNRRLVEAKRDVSRRGKRVVHEAG